MDFKLLISFILLQMISFGKLHARSVHGIDFQKENENELSKDVRITPKIPDRSSTNHKALWQPEGMSRDDWLKYHGLPRDKWLSIVDKMRTIDEIQSFRSHHTKEPTKRFRRQTSDTFQNDNPFTLDVKAPSKGIEEGCMWYTEEQVNEEFEYVLFSSHDTHRRTKRKAEDMEKRPNRKWSNPILYTFDGKHNDRERQIIRDAIKHWEDRTCLKFFEIASSKPLKQQHLMFTREKYGCYSFVGKTATVPQQVNLAASCLTQFGVPIHEIGHALGLWHEQQRSDRDAWVSINRANIGYYSSQFWRRNTVSHGVPYDYGSVMHYAGSAGSINSNPTIEALDPLFTRSMGQRVELSYLDAKIINLEYCKDDCAGRPLPRPCERGGYQDPDNCRRCICPDGFGGRYCERPADATNPECGGVIELSDNGNTEIIQTPGYGEVGHYDDFTQCSWIIKAPQNYKVSLTFDQNDDFAVYCKNSICFHWVEIKYKMDFEYPGPRFCCYGTPQQSNLTSEGEEMVVIFKSNFPTDFRDTRKGFRATLISVPSQDHKSSEDKSSEDDDNENQTRIETTKPTTTTTTTSPPGTNWGPWSKCEGHDCKCGACSQQTRFRMCGEKPCKGESASEESRPCSKRCSAEENYLQYTGTFIWTKCPVCCPGFDLKDEKCVSRQH